MKSIPTHSTSIVAALDYRDHNAGNASHLYGVQYGGPSDVLHVQFQHGPRGSDGATAGIFDDDLLAIIQDRLEGFRSGPYACEENHAALLAVIAAREALALRVARRMNAGVLGANAKH